jgi:hypothetical protein
MEEDLINLMKRSGFKNIAVTTHVIKQMSLRNWLSNSGLSKERQEKIFDLHINASAIFKKAYNMRITKNDCFIDIKNLILIGEKPY